ncbi:carboxypeptidase regulatory-like domain-containing protein [Fodinibius halophilus]|uniref:Carboxypeptidase-like regulatory domain-containing protein n=1 Tax=Fodinibius halophilus TaxID=1736908 RepID=A0A6M1T1F7_9BACT|nr:carboxypeptidase regulatory-like domain-containing protein [Fodinibius halophilus]NGP87809.1 carboxypeptidase-like regulatory domain-containing protein [Fodinibius halophilus]
MYLFKKKVLFSALMLVLGVGLISNQASAQEKANGKLYGKVVDKATGQALSGVEVTLQGADQKATTGDKGMYAFKSLEAGNYTVVIEADGYQKWEKEVNVTAEGKQLMIKLKPQKE